MKPPRRYRAARRRRPGRRGGDSGTGTVEVCVMVAFVFGPILLVSVFLGRMSAGNTAVESAARHAARTISIARDPAAAVSAAQSEAETTVRLGSAMCTSMTFNETITAEQVTVTVECQVDLSEVTVLPLPGTGTASSTSVEVIDQHRETVPA